VSETPKVEKLLKEQPTEEVRRQYDELRAAWLLLDDELRRRSAAEREAGLKEVDFEAAAARIAESFGADSKCISPRFVVIRYAEAKPSVKAIAGALREIDADKFPIRSAEAMVTRVFGAIEFESLFGDDFPGETGPQVKVVAAYEDSPDMSMEVDLHSEENRPLKIALEDLSLSRLARYDDGSRNKSKYHGLMRGLFPEQTAAVEAEFKAIMAALKLTEPTV
jgi:hypothetical protein